MNNNDHLPTERIARLAWELARGRVFTTQQAAEYIGVSVSGVWQMLNKISRVCPLAFYEYHNGFVEPGYWYSTQHYPGEKVV